MYKLIFIVSFSFCSPILFAATLNFRSENTTYSLNYAKDKFTYKDYQGTKAIKISKCNEKYMADYWHGLTKASLKPSGMQRFLSSQSQPAKMNLNGVEYKVPKNTNAYKELNAVKNHFFGLSLESKRLCRKK